MDDIVLTGGRIIDGTGGPAFTADIAISGGMITAMGQLTDRARSAQPA